MKNFRRIKRKLLANHINIVRIGLLVVVFIFFYLISSTLHSALKDNFLYKASVAFSNFLFTPQSSIASFDDRTNILLLGKAGEGNSAPDLTDTIIVASLNSASDSITLMSIPRDIWDVDLHDKINASYMKGEEKIPGGGLILAKSKISEIVGLPIHYAVLVDINALKDVIDVIGGVEITVERSFIDEKYPIPGKENDDCNGDTEYKCRFEILQFIKGTQTMDSETAMKYSRSRQSIDPLEGNDLARAKRQQKVLNAIKEKITSPDVLFSPKKLYALLKIGEDNVTTDLSIKQVAVLARKVLQSKNNINSYVLPEDLLFNPPINDVYDYLYVFIPANEQRNWDDVHTWVSSVLR